MIERRVVLEGRAALTVCAKDLRQRVRDKSLYLIGIVAPFVLAGIVGFALGGSESFSVTVAFADEDHTPLTMSLGEILHSRDLRNVVTVRDENSEAAVRQAVEGTKASAGIVVPHGFAQKAQAGRPADLLVIVDPGDQIAGSFASGISESYAASVQAAQVAVGTATALEGGAPGDPAAIGAAAAQQFPQIDFVQSKVTSKLRPIDYFVPGMGIMFLFFAILYGAATIQAERRTHTLARLAATPVSPSAVLAGKLLALLVTGMLVFAVIVVSTRFAFGVPWGDPLAVILLSFATVLTAIGITGVIAVLARSEQQVRSVGTAVVVLLVYAGGSFIGGQLPAFLRIMQQWTPNGLALIGFTDLVVAPGGGSVGTVWPALVYTAGVGIAGIAITFWFGQRAFRQ